MFPKNHRAGIRKINARHVKEVQVNERQAYALTHPATNPNDVLDPKLSKVRKHPRNFLLMSILAVDR